MNNGTWTKNNGPEHLGGYEKVKISYCIWKRMFTLVRIPKKGAIKKKTLYFTSWQEAVSKGWKRL
jgi:hypothetical protein